MHFKAFKAAAESWFELTLILLLSRLSKFMAEERAGEWGEEGCFWFSLGGTIFLSFFCGRFWRLRFDPLLQRGTSLQRWERRTTKRRWRSGGGRINPRVAVVENEDEGGEEEEEVEKLKEEDG